MQKIYKYRLNGRNVSLPEGAEILDIQYQNINGAQKTLLLKMAVVVQLDTLVDDQW